MWGWIAAHESERGGAQAFRSDSAHTLNMDTAKAKGLLQKL